VTIAGLQAEILTLSPTNAKQDGVRVCDLRLSINDEVAASHERQDDNSV
jgi:hypothetical protein